MSEPTFKSIFADKWDELPDVMKKHYANRPYSDDINIAEGVMKVEGSALWKLLNPFSKLFGILVPYTGENIPVTVTFRSESDSNRFIFDRIFYFPGRAPYKFYSVLHPIKENEVCEIMNMGLGWRCEFSWEDKRVRLKHKGYVLKVFGRIISLPLTFLVGPGFAEEMPIDDFTFSMKMEIIHPWWGKVMGYSGQFRMVEKINGA